MDASRLLAVLNDIVAEYKLGLTQRLKDLIVQYTAARDTPGQDNTAAIQTALDALIADLDESIFADYPPSKASVLDSIGASQRVGAGLRAHLESILSVPGQTTAGIVTGLTQLQADLDVFRKSCVQAQAGLESLKIVPLDVPVGEFDLGVLIPERLVDSSLGALAKELEIWNKVVRGFQEAAGQEAREVTVRSLESGSYQVFLPVGIVAAGMISKTIDKVLEWYVQVLEIRKRRLELQHLGAPTAETGAIKKHERELLDKGIRALAEELVKDGSAKVDAARKSELTNLIAVSIRQIARFVDRGGTIEVDSTPPDEPEEPTQPSEETDRTSDEAKEYRRLKKEFDEQALNRQKVSEIIAGGIRLRSLPTRAEPILQLADGELDSDGVEPEKAPKKKA
jgi:hypothetical protein